MNGKRLVPGSPVPTAAATGVVSAAGLLVSYVAGLPSSRWTTGPIDVALAVVMALVAWYGYELSKNSMDGLLPLLPWLPLVRETGDLMLPLLLRTVDLRFGSNGLYEIHMAFSYATIGAYYVLLLVAVRSVLSSRIAATSPQLPEAAQSKTHQQHDRLDTQTEAAPSPELAAHLKVTAAVRDRSRVTAETARFSMIVMIVLVLLGGGASVGLWFAGQLDRIRSIEVERRRLIDLSSALQQLPQAKSTEQPKILTQLATTLKIRYGEPGSYQELLRELLETAQTSWPDIAIRATVAILTLFLVQIFFSVYKYSEHLSNLLAARAEALELLSVTSHDRQALRKELLAVAREGTPSFAPGPSTPVHDVLELVDRIKGSRNG